MGQGEPITWLEGWNSTLIRQTSWMGKGAEGWDDHYWRWFNQSPLSHETP
jgi:hypothetical protein